MMSEAVAWITGKEPMLTVDGLKMSQHMMFFSSGKAVAELGYSWRPYVQALKDALAWFRREGYL